jgi:hypothetical protein
MPGRSQCKAPPPPLLPLPSTGGRNSVSRLWGAPSAPAACGGHRQPQGGASHAAAAAPRKAHMNIGSLYDTLLVPMRTGIPKNIHSEHVLMCGMCTNICQDEHSHKPNAVSGSVTGVPNQLSMQHGKSASASGCDIVQTHTGPCNTFLSSYSFERRSGTPCAGFGFGPQKPLLAKLGRTVGWAAEQHAQHKHLRCCGEQRGWAPGGRPCQCCQLLGGCARDLSWRCGCRGGPRHVQNCVLLQRYPPN